MKTRGYMAAIVTAVGMVGVAVSTGCDKEPVAGSGSAQKSMSSSSANQGGNAADEYLAISDRLGKDLLDAIANGQPADALLVQHAADIDALVEATKLDTCDFKLDLSQGMNLMMPHLGKMRGLARVMKADAARLLAAGDADGAARRTAGIFRLSQHIAGPARSTIELLVGIAVAALGAEFVTSNPALAKAAWKTDIQQGIAAIDSGFMAHTGDVISSEFVMVAMSLRENKIPNISSVGGRNWSTVSQADRESAAKTIEAMKPDVIAAWSRADAVAQLAALAEKAKSEGVGDLFASYDKMKASIDRLRASLDKASAVLAR